MPIPRLRLHLAAVPVATALAAPAYGGSLELWLRVDAEGTHVAAARPSDAAPDPLRHDAPPLEVFGPDGTTIGAASLPDPRLRSIVAPDGGHGATATRIAGIARVRVPWVEGASVQLGGRALAVPPVADVSRLPAPGQAVKLIDAGPSSDRLDLVFLGDGYTASQQGDFADDVERMVDYLLSIEPYGAYADLFNVWRIDVVSNATGASHDELGTRADTALGCAYGCAGIDRLICCDDAAVMGAVADAVPGADGIMVLINDPTYGGSGGFNYATSYVGGPNDPVVPTQVAAHELGHSLIGLWDEYGYGVRGSGEGPNCSSDPDGAWDVWVGTSGVDAFPECSYTNLHRPTLDECMMRTLQDDYCPVCREQAVLAMYDRLPGLIASVSEPEGSRIDVARGEERSIEVKTHAPADRLTFEWRLDGEPVGEDHPVLELGCSGLDG